MAGRGDGNYGRGGGYGRGDRSYGGREDSRLSRGRGYGQYEGEESDGERYMEDDTWERRDGGRSTPRVNPRQIREDGMNVEVGRQESTLVQRGNEIGEKEKGPGEKRKVDDRSPGQEEGRNNRIRMDEFEIGEKFTKISDKLREEMEELLRRVDRVEEGNTEEMKKVIKDGMKYVYGSVEKVMNGIGDAVAEERSIRESKESDVEVRIRKVEEQAKEANDKAEAVRKQREKESVSESKKDMESLFRLSEKQIKIMDLNFGKALGNRRDIVERVVDYVKEDTRLTDRKRLDILLRRTRIIVLGKGTTEIQTRGGRIHTVPILLEMRTEEDKRDMETILRGAGLYGSYHWPLAGLDFVKGVRDQVKKEGVSEERSYIRIRPEEREGRMQLRVDVKEKTGGKFMVFGTWEIPPLDKALWDLSIFKPKWLRGQRRF
jgi:hypothetical protein